MFSLVIVLSNPPTVSLKVSNISLSFNWAIHWVDECGPQCKHFKLHNEEVLISPRIRSLILPCLGLFFILDITSSIVSSEYFLIENRTLTLLQSNLVAILH